jgi:hypothetical protein
MNKETRCVIIRGDDDGKQTLGNLLVINAGIDAIFATLEPSWQHNKQRLSCIPWGRYTLRKRASPKHGEHLHVQDVMGRDWILIHKGNYRDDTSGCVLIGKRHADLNGDGKLDTIRSGDAMKELLEMLPDRCTLDIVPVLP